LHRYATKNDRIESNESETETKTKTNRIESKKISLGMLRSDLMLESGCPELSPRALRTTAGEDAAADVGKGAGTAAANTPVLRNCIRLPLPEEELLEVTAKAKDYAIMHGAAMRSKTAFSPDSLNVGGTVEPR